MDLTYTISSHYYITTPFSGYQGCILFTRPTRYVPLSYYYPVIIILQRKHIVYLTYTICSNYHHTTEVAYCVPYLHNMLSLSEYYHCSILCTLPTKYSPNIIILLRYHIVYLSYTICSKYHNTTEVAYCVPCLHNMLPLS